MIQGPTSTVGKSFPLNCTFKATKQLCIVTTMKGSGSYFVIVAVGFCADALHSIQRAGKTKEKYTSI